MPEEKRRYPRVACDRSGHMEVRLSRPNRRAERRLVDVHIWSLAPGGAGLELDEDLALDCGTAVMLRFNPTSHSDLELPARVVWTGSRTVGIQFQLELAENDVRRDYARWIVDQLVAAGHSPQKPQSQ